MKTFRLMALAMSTIALPLPLPALADDITVNMHAVSDTGKTESIGTVIISNAAHGIEFTPDLSGLTPGEHGFHIHTNASCEPAMNDSGMPTAALAAGGHYDPENIGEHGSPLSNTGHKGDLTVLLADASGHAKEPVQSGRLGLDDVANRTLMVHVGGDNYSDSPEPLGGGGARFACGVIKR